MAETTQSQPPRVIVVPRSLEGYFYSRLTEYYANRDDIRVVVDRRSGDRRRDRWVSGPGPLADRRSLQRRRHAADWTLADMPVQLS
jgi:hypothetical protein